MYYWSSTYCYRRRHVVVFTDCNANIVYQRIILSTFRIRRRTFGSTALRDADISAALEHQETKRCIENKTCGGFRWWLLVHARVFESIYLMNSVEDSSVTGKRVSQTVYSSLLMRFLSVALQPTNRFSIVVCKTLITSRSRMWLSQLLR